jgi:hypothetical protein
MPPEGVRRSSRIPREIEILLVGSDMEGKALSEKTKTVLLSRHGAGIVSECKLSPEQELILRRLDTNKETEVRVVGKIGEQKSKYTYGVAFLDQSLDFWGVEFPAMSQSEAESRRVQLECARCQERETVQQSDLESDVYLVNEGIVRFCKKCGASTFWKRPSESAEAADPAPSEAPPSPQAAAADPPGPVSASPDPLPAPKPLPQWENRRKYVRTKVSFSACVRTLDFGDDIVTCEDVSRGGLRFKGQRRYIPKADIDIAAPYLPGSQNIFVSAKIVYAQELAEEKLFRCGVAYAAVLQKQSEKT